jgi:hypothetical protein
MNRRNFLSTVAVGGLAAVDSKNRAPLNQPPVAKEVGREPGEFMAKAEPARQSARRAPSSAPPIRKIGRWTLEEIRGHFQKELETDVISLFPGPDLVDLLISLQQFWPAARAFGGRPSGQRGPGQARPAL